MILLIVVAARLNSILRFCSMICITANRLHVTYTAGNKRAGLLGRYIVDAEARCFIQDFNAIQNDSRFLTIFIGETNCNINLYTLSFLIFIRGVDYLIR